jgi:hypothetical protein
VTRNSDTVTDPLRRNLMPLLGMLRRNKLGRLEVVLVQRRHRRLLDLTRSSTDEPAVLVGPNLELLAVQNASQPLDLA